MGKTVRLDHQGIAQLLVAPFMREAVHELGEQIADDVRGRPTVKRHSAEVTTEDAMTGYGNKRRWTTFVTIEHSGALAMQAKYGVLTKAIRADVREDRRVKSRRAAKIRRQRKRAEGEAFIGFVTGTRR